MDQQQRRAVIGRTVMGSGVVLLVLAALFWWDIVPIDPEAKTPVTAVVLGAAAIDFAIGLFYLRS